MCLRPVVMISHLLSHTGWLVSTVPVTGRTEEKEREMGKRVDTGSVRDG